MKRQSILGIIMVFFGGSNCLADSSDGLVAYYPFNNNANDMSPNGLNGTIYGATFIQGIQGNAIYFDGIDDYVDYGYSSLFKIQGDISASFWINRQGGSTFIAIEGGGGNTGDEYYQNAIFFLCESVTNAGELRYIHEYGNGLNQQKDFDVIPYSVWMHIAVTRDSAANLVSVYYDGTFIDAYNYSVQPSNPLSELNLTIGSRSLGDRVFAGMMDEVRVYDRVLGYNEIQELAVPVPSAVLLGSIGLAYSSWKLRKQRVT